MKKTTLTLILILLCNSAFTQKIWFIDNPKGFDFYLTTTVEDDIITGMTRGNALIDIVGRFKFTLAKLTTSIVHPEIVHFEGVIREGAFKGKYQKLFDQLSFNGEIKNDSIKIIIHEDNKTTKLKGIKVDNIIPVRNYKETVNTIIQLTENDINNQKYIKSGDWFEFKIKMLKICHKINDDFEFEIAFGGIAKDLPEEFIKKIKENAKVILNK